MDSSRLHLRYRILICNPEEIDGGPWDEWVFFRLEDGRETSQTLGSHNERADWLFLMSLAIGLCNNRAHT